MTDGTYLVTGAAGFIGSHISEALLTAGHHVVGIDNFNAYYDPEIKRQNIRELKTSFGSDAKFVLHEGDFRDRTFLEHVVDHFTFTGVLHLGAMAGVRASIMDPGLYYDVNLNGTLTLLDVLLSHDGPAPHFVFASTSSVYGQTDRVPFREDDPCDKPLVPYSASKRAAELLGHAYNNLHRVDFTVLRYFTVYGPRNRPDMMSFKLLESIERGTEVPLHGSGHMTRDWTFIADIVQGTMAALRRPAGYQIFNLGRGQPILLTEFINVVERLTGKSARLRSVPSPPGDVTSTAADITQAREILGYDPQTSIDDGVAQLVHWYERSRREQ